MTRTRGREYKGRRQSNVGRSIYRPPRLLDGIIAWGWSCNRGRNWWRRGSILHPSLLPPRRSMGRWARNRRMHTRALTVHRCERRGKSRDDVNDPAVGFQSHLSLSLSFLLFFFSSIVPFLLLSIITLRQVTIIILLFFSQSMSEVCTLCLCFPLITISTRIIYS